MDGNLLHLTPEALAAVAEPATRRAVVVGNARYGLYYGYTDCSNEYVALYKAIRLYGCRHITLWYSYQGGVTSLAAYGPTGPQASKSRVGAPADSYLTDVVNIYECTADAVKAFDGIQPGEPCAE